MFETTFETTFETGTLLVLSATTYTGQILLFILEIGISLFELFLWGLKLAFDQFEFFD